MLAFTLEQLYRDHYDGERLSRDAYKGLSGAIDAAMARVFVAANSDPRIPQDHDARLTLLRRGLIPWLAGIDPESKNARRNKARASQIPEEARPLIDLMVEQRLLTRDVKNETGETTIEPTHEALLRQWGLLKGWLEEDFALLTTLEGVKRASGEWDANAQANAWLAHQGERLADAQNLDARPDIASKLDSLDRAYLAKCRAKEAAARAKSEQRRKEREEELSRRVVDARKLALRTTIGFIVAAALALLVGAFGIFAQREQTIADAKSIEAQIQREAAVQGETKARNNQSAALAALSNVVLPSDPLSATKLALAAWPRRHDDHLPKLRVTLAALSSAVEKTRARRILRGHADRVISVALSPDGTRVVTASRDQTARVWTPRPARPSPSLEDTLVLQ